MARFLLRAISGAGRVSLSLAEAGTLPNQLRGGTRVSLPLQLLGPSLETVALRGGLSEGLCCAAIFSGSAHLALL